MAQLSRKLKPKHIGIPIKKTIQSPQSRRFGAKRTRTIHTIERLSQLQWQDASYARRVCAQVELYGIETSPGKSEQSRVEVKHRREFYRLVVLKPSPKQPTAVPLESPLLFG